MQVPISQVVTAEHPQLKCFERLSSGYRPDVTPPHTLANGPPFGGKLTPPGCQFDLAAMRVRLPIPFGGNLTVSRPARAGGWTPSPDGGEGGQGSKDPY